MVAVPCGDCSAQGVVNKERQCPLCFPVNRKGSKKNSSARPHSGGGMAKWAEQAVHPAHHHSQRLFIPPHHTPTLPHIGYLPALSPPKKLFPSPSFHSSFTVANKLLSNRQASLCGHYTKLPHSSLLPKLEVLGSPQTLCAAG